METTCWSYHIPLSIIRQTTMLLIRKRATGKNERESVSCKAFFARRPGARSCEKKRYHLQPTRQVFWATRDEDWLHDFLNKRLKKIVTKQTKQPRQKNARKIVFSNVASPPPLPQNPHVYQIWVN